METFLYIVFVLFLILGIGLMIWFMGRTSYAVKVRKKYGYSWANIRPGIMLAIFGNRGWMNISICRSCGARGFEFEHMFCSAPCKFCGEKDRAEAVGRWNSKLKLWETPDEVKLRKEGTPPQ
jgi:ribosomal protein L37E